jgi:hypothetical protein
MKTKSQNIILATGDKGNLIIRGLELSTGMAKIYAEEYVGNVRSLKSIDGDKALVYAIFNTKVLDIDADCIL